MGETQNLRNNRIEKYDALYGRHVRDIKTTDIINIFAKESPTDSDTVEWNMVTYTTDANHAVYPYIFHAHNCGICTCAQMYLMNGTDTVACLMPGPNDHDTIITGCDCPFTRIAPSSTLTIRMEGVTSACTADTYCAWVVAKREPIVSVVEN